MRWARRQRVSTSLDTNGYLGQVEDMRTLLLSALAAASLTIGGCGLRPLYANGSGGAVAQVLADVDVAPIAGHEGWLVRNALRDRLQATQGGDGAGKRLRLDVRLEDSITGFGVRADDAVTRERRTLRARYQLIEAATGEVLLDATAAQDAGIDVVGSEYATIAAESTALERLASGIADQIVSRLAVYANRGGGQGAATPTPSPAGQ
jgi:LPS-assembly lipoprotein